MATTRQRLSPRQTRFKKEYARSGNAYQSALFAGYSENFAKQISVRMSDVVRNGVEDAVEDYGLNEGLIKTSLVDDIKAKPKNRKPELELGAKILRMITEKPEGGEAAPQLHLHLHREEKVIKIVSEAEKQLRAELEDEIVEPVSKTQQDKGESKDGAGKAEGQG